MFGESTVTSWYEKTPPVSANNWGEIDRWVVIRNAESELLGNRKAQVGDVVDYFLYKLVISPHVDRLTEN